MRLLTHLLAIIGLLGMTTNVASKLMQSHHYASYGAQNPPAVLHQQ
jgi:hypothetical protein